MNLIHSLALWQWLLVAVAVVVGALGTLHCHKYGCARKLDAWGER